MKTKNIAMIIIINSLMTSAPCHGMDYMNSSYNSLTSMISNNMMNARNWTSNFINSCRKVSILGTIYATFGIYDFNKITGLDKNKLGTYHPQELKNGMDRLNTMAIYGRSSQKLEDFYQDLQTQYLRAQNKEQTEELTPEQEAALKEAKDIMNTPYDEKEALKDIQELLNKK